VGVFLSKAAVYQPLDSGGLTLNAPFPGMPQGIGIKVVNNFARLGGDYYVPPQRGEFSFGLTLGNSGSRPITIEAVTTSDDLRRPEFHARLVMCEDHRPGGRIRVQRSTRFRPRRVVVGRAGA
jgi:hypothetical protein